MSEPASRHTPRSAAALLSLALGHLDRLEPVGVREPVRLMFRAAIERCVVSRSLLGAPVVAVLDLAQALVDEAQTDRAERQP